MQIVKDIEKRIKMSYLFTKVLIDLRIQMLTQLISL